jgi:Ca2+-binding RTX toxin-like protein
VTLAAGANFAAALGGADVGTGYGELLVNGTLDLGGATLDLSLFNQFQAALGEQFDIITSAKPIVGTFAGLPEGAAFHADGETFTISYHGGFGDDVVLTRVAAATIIIRRPGHHKVDATHTVAGQPLPTNFGDLIICRRANDVVHAGTGDNMLVAGSGADALYGGPGNNIFVVGSGDDRLFGGTGDNTFVFKGFHTDAHIFGFHHGDKLELARAVFHSAGDVHYDRAIGALLFGAHGEPPVQFATLAPHIHLTHYDYVFV